MTPRRDRYPRTLEEAFGPYARGSIEDPDASRGDSLVVRACLLALVALIVILNWSGTPPAAPEEHHAAPNQTI